jgi:hypothetical protein
VHADAFRRGFEERHIVDVRLAGVWMGIGRGFEGAKMAENPDPSLRSG